MGNAIIDIVGDAVDNVVDKGIRRSEACPIKGTPPTRARKIFLITLRDVWTPIKHRLR